MANITIIRTVKDYQDKKTALIQIPKNVIDSEYFQNCVQFHINVIQERSLSSAYTKAVNAYNKEASKTDCNMNKLDELAKKIKEANDNCDKWTEYIKEYSNHMLESYEQDMYELLKDQFRNDGYAQLFALSIIRKSKIGENDVDFTNSEVTTAMIFNAVRRLTLDVNMSKAESDKCIKDIKTYICDNFGTEAVTGVYKKTNVSKLNPTKIREEVGTCLTKKASHNAKGGGIQKEYVKYFDVALELLFQFYKLQGVEEFSKNNTKTIVTISGNSGKLDLSKIQKKTK